MKNNYPNVSIITVNFNGKKYLKKFFDSVFRLNYPKNKLELILVDNVSTDNSVESVKKNYHKVKIIRNNINNYCKGINLGIKASKAKYVALVNNDTRMDKDWLIELIGVISKDTQIAGVGGKILNMAGRIQNAAHYELPDFYWGERGAGEAANRYSIIEEVPSLCGAAVLYRKEALLEAGLFDEDFIIYGEDVDMALRLTRKGYKLVFVPKSIVYHKFHGTASEELARYYIERNRLLFLAKHYPHKLSNSLIGNGYFTIKKSTNSCGRIYSIFPDVIMKLIKTHQFNVSKEVIIELFGELGRIFNYENDLLIKKFNEMADDQRQKVQELLLRDGQLIEKDRQIKDYIESLHGKEALREELNNLSTQLRQRMDEVLLKDGAINEKDTQIAHLKSELNILSEQLRQRMDEVLLKDSEICRLKDELNGIYNSEGFRFVLHPLWKIIWHMRRCFKRFIPRALSRFFWFIITVMAAPIFLSLSLCFFLEYTSWLILSPALKKVRPAVRRSLSFLPEGTNVSLVMPNYNGVNYLMESLPSIFSSDGFSNGLNEVLVIDDASTDGSVDFIKNNFPGVRLLQNRKNKGFGFSCNRGIKEAKNDVVVLINNDVILTKDFLKPLISHLRERDIFAVTPKLYGWDKKSFVWGMHMGRFQDGYIRLWNEADTGNGDRIAQTSPTIFAIGGAMVFRRSDFLWLGGFDSIYRPNCWEDIDLSYRAWKRGLRVLYEPRSLMYHKGRATLTYERPKEIKNELLFTWKNITDIEIIKNHLNLLPRDLYYNGMNFLKGFFWALAYLPQTLVHRFLERRYVMAQDAKIFDQNMLYYRNFMRRNFNHLKSGEKKHILLVTSAIPYPLNVGGKIRIYTLARLLAKKYDISLLTLLNKEEEEGFVPELKKIFREVYAVYPKTEIKSRLYPQRYKYAHSHTLIDKLIEIQKGQAIDLVQIESNELLYLAGHIKHIPIIYTEHDSSVLFFRKSYYQIKDGSLLFNLFDYLKRVRFHYSIYKRLERVILLSREDEKVLRTFFPRSNFSFIPTGVDIGHFTFLGPDRPKPKRLIYIGHYLHYPNEDAVIYFIKRIFPHIRKKMPDIEFLIVGSNPTDRIKRFSNRANIRLIGDVEDVGPYLRESGVFVNPIRISAGIKGKVLEAMSSGIPVVSTKQGASGISARDGEEILIAETPSKFIRAVMRVLKDDILYSKIACNARILVEKEYDWQNISQSLGQVYEDTINFSDRTTGSKTKVPDPALSEYCADNREKKRQGFDDIVNLSNQVVEEAVRKARFDSGPDHGPEELHIELTYNCNSQCLMCDLWDYHNRIPAGRKELTFEEIRGFVEKSERLNKVKTVVLSGGEPFLRKDLPEICGYLIERLPHVSIGILTNGLNTDAIIKTTKEIINKYNPPYLWLGSSLDGIGEAHDKIRAKEGAFSCLEKTIRSCKKEGINITLTFTLTASNFDQLIPAKKFSERYGLDFYIQFVVPKEARERPVFSFTHAQLKKIEADIGMLMSAELRNKDCRHIAENIRDGSYQGLVARLYYLSNLVRYQRDPKRWFLKCVSGTRFSMVSPFGDLYFCPGLKNGIIGNIREDRFDDLWTSKKAENIREFINQGLCHCWLVCVVFPVIDAAIGSMKNNTEKIQAAEPPPKIRKKELVGIEFVEENKKLNEQEYLSGKIDLASTPQGVGIGAHWRCNADCIFCLRGYPRYFDLDTYRRFFEEKLHSVLTRAEFVNLCGFGELLLMPHCEEFLDYINKTLAINNKIITTNGIPLSKAIEQRLTEGKYSLQISLHASDKRLHQFLTHTDSFDRIISGIQHLASVRRNRFSPSINLIFIINTFNIENLPDFVEFSAKLGADSVFANYMTAYTPAHLKLSCFFKQEITNRMFSEAQERAERFKFSLSLPPEFGTNGLNYTRCSDPWKYIYIENEGSVLPCCYAGGHIGYLYRDDFDEIWNGGFYKDLRRSLIEGVDSSWCRYCYKNKPSNVNDIRSHVSSRPDLQESILRGIE